MKHKSLKTKVLLSFGTISFFMLVAFGFIFYYFLNQSMIETTKNGLYSQSFYIKEHLSTTKFSDIHAKFPFAIVKNSQTIYKTKEFDFKGIEKIIHKKKPFSTVERKGSQTALYVLEFKKPFDGAIAVFKDDIDEGFENVITIIIALESILFLLFILLANKMVNKILKPIQNISTVAKDISIHNFQNKIPLTESEDEIRNLIDTFNTMVDRLKDGVEKLDRFNSDVSHELKTPLTVINGKIELALKKDRDRAYYKESLNMIQSESHKIQKIVEELLQLSKYSKENIVQSFVPCDLNAILLGTVDQYLPKALAKNIDLEIIRFEKATKNASPELINAIFSNLIDNAVKYTSPGKNIHISLWQERKMIHFIIQDEGIGIAQKNLSKITDRFYRVDESRNKETEGFGLGLSIVKNSIELHKGELYITSKLDIGTTVEVIL